MYLDAADDEQSSEEASAHGVQLPRAMSVTKSAGKRSAVNTQHLSLAASDLQVIYLCIHQVLKEKEAKTNLLLLIFDGRTFT